MTREKAAEKLAEILPEGMEIRDSAWIEMGLLDNDKVTLSGKVEENKLFVAAARVAIRLGKNYIGEDEVKSARVELKQIKDEGDMSVKSTFVEREDKVYPRAKPAAEIKTAPEVGEGSAPPKTLSRARRRTARKGSPGSTERNAEPPTVVEGTQEETKESE